MSVMNRLASRIRGEKHITITQLCLVDHLSPYTIEKLRPYLLDLFQDIRYEKRMFHAIEETPA